MLLRIAILSLLLIGLNGCNPTKMTDTGDSVISDSGAFLSSVSAIQVSSANPSSGNALIDQRGGISTPVNDGTGRMRVRLNKIQGSTEYDLYVYFHPTSAVVSHVSLSWTTNNRSSYLNAYTTSPAGVVVDLNNKTISFMNTLLNSGLPSTANLNGQFEFQYR